MAVRPHPAVIEEGVVGLEAVELALEADEEIGVISKMLGHADYSTTVDVYSHLSTERSRVAAARIDALLKRREEVAS